MFLRISLLLVLAVSQFATAQGAGRPKGLGPLEPLREPHFVLAAKADFFRDEDQVWGVNAYGVAKTYPTQVRAWHHIIHD